MRRYVRSLTTVTALTLPTVCWAQAAPNAVSQDKASQEIVVTAQKRSESLEDVPISINVVSGKALETAGVANITGITKLVPAVRFDNSGPYSQPTIRGVGSALAGPGLSPNVATYIDGFYQANPISNNSDLLDVTSIQVLKGPQGTLFGRNATGGAIVITTEDPSQDFSVKGNLSYGRFNQARAGLLVSGGLSDNLTASLGVNYRHDDGFVTNLLTGHKDSKSDRFTARAKLVFTPSDTTKFTLIGKVEEIDDPSAYSMSAYQGETTGVLFPDTIIATRRGEISNDVPGVNRVHSQFLGLKSEFDLGGVSLTSLTGWRRDRARENYDIDASSAPVLAAFWNQNDDVFTQEFNLNSDPSSKLQWVVGANYFYNKSDNPNFAIATGGSGLIPTFFSRVYTHSLALFADATYPVLPNLYLTIGGRYSHDYIREAFGTAPSFTEDGATDERDAFKPRGVLRYEFAPRTNVYVSVSQGNKAAVFNANGQDKNVVKPENITAYELGFKTASGSWNFETAGFYYDYKDLQVASFVGTATRVLNAANARIYGLEAHASGALNDHFRVDIGAAYVDGQYRNFEKATRYTFGPTTGVVVSAGDASGNAMQRTPKFSGNAMLTYDTPLADGNLELSGSVTYQSKIYFDFFEDTKQNGYALVDLRAAWTAPSEAWTIAVYGRNITDQTYLSSVLANAVSIAQLYGQPATYGAELQFRF